MALDSLEEFRLAILSNGSPDRLASAVRAGGLTSVFSEVISIDRHKFTILRLGPTPLGEKPEGASGGYSVRSRTGGSKELKVWFQCLVQPIGCGSRFTPDLVVTPLDQRAPRLA
jgi:hypothetical protein